MTKPKGVDLAELMKLTKPAKRPRFTAEHERRYAMRALALVAELSQAERGRVLRRALKINDI